MAHARFAPSSAQRVIDCPASLTLNETEPDSAGIDAAHGTAAHFLGETSLSKRSRTEKYAGCSIGVLRNGTTWFVHENAPAPANDDGWVFEVDDEMVIGVQEYVDWCNDAPGDKYVEIRVDISHWCPEPEQFGTSDHIAIDGRVMYVTDLKYGKGVKVYAKDNPQAILYALGALRQFDPFDEIEEIHIRICQPRLDHKDVWIVTREELLAWGDYIRERFALALTPHPPFGPTEKACKFCKVSARCRALADHLSAHRAMAFDDISEDFVVDDPRLLTDEELVEAWRMTPLIKARYTAIAKEILTLLLDGHPLPTVRLAHGKTNRRFKDKNEALLFLKLDCDLSEDQLYEEPKLKSVAQIEKLLPKAQKKELAQYAEMPKGGPRIVDEDSKSPAYEATSPVDFEEIFGNEDDGEDE